MSTPVLPTQSISGSRENKKHRWNHSTLAHALACLADPPTLAAIGLLLFNDHVLKTVVPSWLTGKLSDVAGLYFFPFLVLAGLGLFELALPRRFRSSSPTVRSHRLMGVALALSGLWFLALKATPASNAYAVALLDAVLGGPHHVVVDPTDLIALAVPPLTWLRWKAIVQQRESLAPDQEPRRMRWFRFAALALASFAALATPPPPPPPVSFGCISDVAADSESADTLYASLATQQVTQWSSSGGDLETENIIETYRSQDGGRSWALYAPVGGYLWADPRTPDRLYVLNEEGLHRIQDGQPHLLDVPFEALHFQPLADYSGSANVLPGDHSLAFDPLTPGVLYLTDGGRILTSSDGGETWNRLTDPGTSERLLALTIAPSAPQTLYASTGSSVLRSDDGGNSWFRNVRIGDDAQIRALAVHPSTPEIVYAGGQGVYRSLDGGVTWQRVHDTSVRNVALHPLHPHLIYAAGWITIFSDDGGDTWVSPEGQHSWDVTISPTAPHRTVLALCDKGVTVQESLTPTMIVPPPTPTPPLGLASSDEPTVVYADALAFGRLPSGGPTTLYSVSGEPPTLGRSDDGGASWIVHPLTDKIDDLPNALVARSVSPASTLTSLVALGRRTAYSLTWRADGVEVERFKLPDDGDIKGTRPLLADPSDPNLFLTTGRGSVLRSDDGGQTWITHALSPTASFSQPTTLPYSAHPVTLYATTDVKTGDVREQIVFRSDDGGITWQFRSRLTDTHRLAALAVHPADPDIVYGGGVGLYQSGDGGATWTLLYPEITIRTLAIVPDDPRLLYAISDEGVARSDDGGMTWAVVCPAGRFDGPAEFLGITIAPIEPHLVTLLARPTRPDVNVPSIGTCRDPTGPRYDLLQGWQQSSGGLPVFVRSYGG